MSRTPFKPTDEQREQVQAMVGFGVRESDICLLIKNHQTGKPIDEKTLCKHFRREIDTGRTIANTNVAKSMYEMATKGDATSTKLGAAAFWLARRAGWKETNKVELTGEDGEAIKVDHARERIAGRVAELHEKLRSGEIGVVTTNGSGRHLSDAE